jgi:hypothetical protein
MSGPDEFEPQSARLAAAVEQHQQQVRVYRARFKTLVWRNLPAATAAVDAYAERLEDDSHDSERRERKLWWKYALVGHCLATEFEDVPGHEERAAVFQRLCRAIGRGKRKDAIGRGFDAEDVLLYAEQSVMPFFTDAADTDKTFYEVFGLDVPLHLRTAAEALAMIAFTVDELRSPVVPPRYLIPGLVPCEAYSILAGALSAGKTTAALSLAVWRATGVDVLGLDRDDARAVTPGPVTFITYEDADSIIVSRLKHILHHHYARIEQAAGTHAADAFYERFAKHFRRIHLTGQPGAPLVVRSERGQPEVNTGQINVLDAALRAHAASEHLIVIDPLRLAFRGSQNDDDGADLAVMVLNDLATRLKDSALLACSHTTKAMAAESGTNRVALAYATAGSGLYSQHARSNFHMGRPEPEALLPFVAAGTLTPEEAERRQVTELTHARLSYETERQSVQFAMRGGVLIPLPRLAARSPMEVLRAAWPVVMDAVDRIEAEGNRATQTLLVADPSVLRGRSRDEARWVVRNAIDQGWLVAQGRTRDRHLIVSAAGRELARF